MKVVYDEYTGKLNNIYYIDGNDPSGYSIHNVPESESRVVLADAVQWVWGAPTNDSVGRI